MPRPPKNVSTMPRPQPMPLRSPRPSRQASGNSTTPAQKQRWKVRSAGVNPMSMPCRAATNPAAQNTRRARAASDADGDGAGWARWIHSPSRHGTAIQPLAACAETRMTRRPRLTRAAAAYAVARPSRDRAFATGRGMLRIAPTNQGVKPWPQEQSHHHLRRHRLDPHAVDVAASADHGAARSPTPRSARPRPAPPSCICTRATRRTAGPTRRRRPSRRSSR